VRRGRAFSELDRADAPLVAVINETMVRMFYPNLDAVGQRLLMDGPNSGSTSTAPLASYQIVGVIADERLTPFDDRRTHPVVYVSNLQDPRDFAGVIVRTSLDPQRLESTVRTTLTRIDRGVSVTHVTTMGQWLSESMVPDRYRSLLLGALSLVAVLLAAIGIYGVISYSVAQRRHEIGIRSALGATPSLLIGLVVGEGFKLAVAGLAVGAVAAVATARFLATFLFGVGPFDAVAWSAAALIMAGVAVAASYIPGRDAARVDPLEALRAE
jgi:putative ABC transport system permease protein